NKQKKITQQDLVDAIARVQMGPEKRSHKVTARDRRITAYHESGHALIGNLLPECDDVHLITIVPRGDAGGYTLSLPSEENDNMSKTALLSMITMALGGHAAEKVALEDLYTGSSSDLKRATDLSRRMVTQFGMSDAMGTMYLSSDNEVFVGMEFGQSREFSEQTAAAIDAEVKRVLDECYRNARKIIEDNKEKLVAVAETLLVRETLSRAEFEAVMRGEELPPLSPVEQIKPSESVTAETAETTEPTETNEAEAAQAVAFEPAKVTKTIEDQDPFVEP
ncbi:MAG: cell division protein FtsH, partial [Clostridia bacterium]